MIVERNFTTNEDVKYNTKTPNIYLWTCILLSLKQFRCGEVQASTEGLEMAFGREEIAKTEVDDFDISSFANQNVFDFQVPVHDGISVAVIQSTSNLPAKFTRLLFLEPAMRDDVVQHLSAIDIFKEHIPMITGSYDVSHAANVRVI